MFSFIWHTFFFDPVYNGLIFFIDILPDGDVGLAIIAITLLVKAVLLPLSLQAAATQRAMRQLEPKLKEIKETHKDNREAQARAMLDLYKESGVNPFASFLLLFIQIPIIISVYLAVMNGGGVALPSVNTDLLYRFVSVPEEISMLLFGAVDIAGKSAPLAFLAAFTQFIHAQLTIPKPKPRSPDAAPDFKEDFTRSMQTQMRYVMPVIIFVVAYTISAAIALYLLVSNLTMIAQEYYVKWRHEQSS